MPDENMTPKVRRAMKTVIGWMHEQMYEKHTEWTCGNEHDTMRSCCDLLEKIAGSDDD